MRTLLELWGLVQSANSRYASVISETNITDTLASIDRVTLRVYRFRHLIIVKFQLTLCNKSGSTLAHCPVRRARSLYHLECSRQWQANPAMLDPWWCDELYSILG